MRHSLLFAAAILLPVALLADQVELPYVFVDGTPTSADQINANFSTLEAAIEDLYVQAAGGAAAVPGGDDVVDQTSLDAGSCDTGPAWQSFTAGITGNLVAVSVYGQGGTVAVEIHTGEGTGGAVIGTGTADTMAWADAVVDLDAPVPLVAGQVYTISNLGLPGTSWCHGSADTYPDGTSFNVANPASGSFDYYFQTWMEGQTWQGNDACPAGFVDISAAGNQLGCMQATEHGSATWETASSTCFLTFGGRLPSSGEWFISADNFDLVAETDDWEWNSDAYSANSHTLTGSGSVGANSSSADAQSRAYRCWIPR